MLAPLELKKQESQYLAKKNPLLQIESSIIANKTAQNAVLKELLEMDRQIMEQKENFIQSLNTLKSAIASWMQRYVIKASISGNISFTNIIHENQYLKQDQELFYIVPEIVSYTAEMNIPQDNLGKVRKGQKVLVKMVSYPFQEFGALEGVVQSISEVSGEDNSYLVNIDFPNGLNTSSGKKIAYKSGLTATGEIITSDTRVIEELFYQLKKITNVY